MTRYSFLSYAIFNRPNNIAFILWVVFFCYAVCSALIFQKLFLPSVTSFQTGSGLISNDAAYFDSIASLLADKIRADGWSAWSLYPTPAAPGNVGILAAFYVLFGHDPSLVIPLNAALHAFGGLLVYLLSRELADQDSIGTSAGIIAGSLFVIFPSALVWYAQNHKDSYAIAGMLLILLVWVKVIKNPFNTISWCWLSIGNLFGTVLVGLVRPYNLKLLLIAATGIILALIISAVSRRKVDVQKKTIGFFLIVIITLIGISQITIHLGGGQSDEKYAQWQDRTQVYGHPHEQWHWMGSAWLPEKVEHYIEAAAKTRAGLIAYGIKIKAKSMIDEDKTPHSIEQVAAYLPRALQIALFAPFPTSWLINISMPRLIAAGEMFIYYLCVPGLFILLFYNRKPPVLLAIYFACFFLLIYGFTQANLGTLYRYRYGYLFIILTLGILGWLTWLENTNHLKQLFHLLQPNRAPLPQNETTDKNEVLERKQVIGSGVIVIGLTLLSFIGFFLRDILMAKIFGLGETLDNFFIALLIPMFIVTVLCMPLGTAFIPIYLNLQKQGDTQSVQALLSYLSFWTLFILLIICFTLYMIGPALVPFFYIKKLLPDMVQLTSLLNLALPILFFSSVVILGNAVLNANGRTTLTSVAQLIVPITAIGSLLLFGTQYGVKAVMLGMVIGQLLNLFIVQYYLRYFDVSLLPRLNLHSQLNFSPFLRQYLPLVVSAFFVAVAPVVSTLLAIYLPEGGVSALNLGNKVVMFITTLVSTAISTVMLPYFAALITKNHLVSARRELSFFLLFVTFVSVPISAVLYIWAESIVRLIFESNSFNKDSTQLVSQVMQYAVAQIPFFVCNSLLVKFAIATKHVYAVSTVSVIGLFVNIGTSIWFMNHMGVAGIALGSSISMAASTLLLVLIMVRYWHIGSFDALLMLLSWLLFITLLMGIHFQSTASVWVTVFTGCILLIGYFNSLKPHNLILGRNFD